MISLAFSGMMALKSPGLVSSWVDISRVVTMPTCDVLIVDQNIILIDN